MTRLKWVPGRLFLVLCIVWASVSQAEYPAQPSLAVTAPRRGARALKPILPEPLTHPSVCRGPDDAFYLTGSPASSQSDSSPDAVWVWRSKDLLHWNALGQVWTRSEDHPNQGVHAPEIHYIQGAFYVVYALSEGGIQLLKSESGAQGPYQSLGELLQEGHHPSLFEDSRGRVYLLYDQDKIVRVDLDKVTLVNKPRTLRWEDASKQTPAMNAASGLFMFQQGRQYYLFYSQPDVRLAGQVQDTFVAHGDNPYGPFEPGYLAIPHASTACVFEDDMGHVWATFSALPQDNWAALIDRPGLVNLTLTEAGRFRAQANVILEKGIVAHLQPRVDEMLVSPSVTRGHDDQYYMVGSDTSWQAPSADCHVTLWRSSDLETWESMGDILTYDEDLIHEPSLDHPVPLLSAELMYSRIRNEYFLVFTTLDRTAKTWLYHSISNNPEGPYANVTDSFMVEGVDGALYEEGQNLYLMWSNGKLAKLNRNATGLDGPVHQLAMEDGTSMGTEGMHLVKAGKHYVWTAAQWHGDQPLNRTYDLVAAVSDSLLGPYRAEQFVLPHAGHSTLFHDHKDQWYAVFSGHDKTAPFRNRPGIVKLDIQSSGEILPAPEQ